MGGSKPSPKTLGQLNQIKGGSSLLPVAVSESGWCSLQDWREHMLLRFVDREMSTLLKSSELMRCGTTRKQVSTNDYNRPILRNSTSLLTAKVGRRSPMHGKPSNLEAS